MLPAAPAAAAAWGAVRIRRRVDRAADIRRSRAAAEPAAAALRPVAVFRAAAALPAAVEPRQGPELRAQE
jgi:hypothetical protein